MKKRLLATLLTLCLIAGLLPTSVLAADDDPLDGATTIYVSNQGSGDGTTESFPTTLEGALKQINEATSDSGNPLKFIISVTEDIERTGTTDFYFENHIITLLGNGHTIRSSESLGTKDNAVLHLGKEDGTDTLTLKELVRAQAHTVVSAGNGVSYGEVHMYDGVSILGADDAFENDSSGHGVGAHEGTFYMHGGEISGFCIPQPGAGIIINNGQFYMYDGIIQNCESKGETQFGGGAIWGDGTSEIHILGGELKNNRADNRGGAIATQNNVKVEIKGDAKITGNVASRGGAISIQNSSSLVIAGNVVMSDNTCIGNGGAISALSGCAVSISGGVFKDNCSSTGYGGAIYHQRDSSGQNAPLIVSNAVFTGNQAAYGGAILSLGGLGNSNEMTTTLKDCTFEGNSAHSYETEDTEGEPATDGGFGGAIYVQDIKLTIENCTIEDNAAEDSGGGVYFTGNTPDLMELNLKGATQVWNNKCGQAQNNVYLRNLVPEDGGVTEEYQSILTVAGNLVSGSENAKIGITMDKPGVFTKNYATQVGGSEPEKYFVSDDLAYHVALTEDGEGQLVQGQADFGDVTITPANITIYTGGEGYTGTVDNAGNESTTANGLPEPGYYITLPDELNAILGGDTNVENLSDILKFTYEDDEGRAREWKLELYGTDAHSSNMEGTERQRYIYRMLPGVDENEQEIPVRLQFTDSDGNVKISDEFTPNMEEQYQEYTMSIYSGGLETSKITASLTPSNGQTVTCGVNSAKGTLIVRGLTGEDITTEIVGNESEISGDGITALAPNDVTYYINGSNVELKDTEGVRLLVDDVLDDGVLVQYIQNSMTEKIPAGDYAYEQQYLDLVDTKNGNAYLTMDKGDKLTIYWKVPDGFDSGKPFYIVHFDALDRNYDKLEDELSQNTPELLTAQLVTVSGTQYVKFVTSSFSPFVLVYEKESGSGGDGGGTHYSYTLRYNTNGGEAIRSESRSYSWMKKYEDLPVPVRNGYIFDGWYLDSRLTVPVENDVKVNRSTITLYAGWSKHMGAPDSNGISGWLNTRDHNAYLNGYGNGTFGPDNNMTRAQVAQMFYNLLLNKDVPATVTFSDVPADAWYATAVNTLASLGIVNGIGNGQFAPDQFITRAQFTVIAMRFTNGMTGTTNGENIFSDVNTSDWFYDQVVGSIQYGWITGYSDGTFQPNKTISRAEVTTIVNRMLGRSADEDYVDRHEADLHLFLDVNKDYWAYYQIVEATNAHNYEKNGNTENWTKLG